MLYTSLYCKPAAAVPLYTVVLYVVQGVGIHKICNAQTDSAVNGKEHNKALHRLNENIKG